VSYLAPPTRRSGEGSWIPNLFDIGRKPNPHLAFGASSPLVPRGTVGPTRGHASTAGNWPAESGSSNAPSRASGTGKLPSRHGFRKLPLRLIEGLEGRRAHKLLAERRPAKLSADMVSSASGLSCTMYVHVDRRPERVFDRSTPGLVLDGGGGSRMSGWAASIASAANEAKASTAIRW